MLKQLKAESKDPCIIVGSYSLPGTYDTTIADGRFVELSGVHAVFIDNIDCMRVADVEAFLERAYAHGCRIVATHTSELPHQLECNVTRRVHLDPEKR